MNLRARAAEIALILWMVALVGTYLWSSLGARLTAVVSWPAG